MSDKEQPPVTTDEEGKKRKIIRARKPQVKPGPESFRYGVTTPRPARKYGPCSFEVTIASHAATGTADEAVAIHEFGEIFNKVPELCMFKGFSVRDGSWTVVADLASDGKDVDDPFITAMFHAFNSDFELSPVLKREFGAGKAGYIVRNGGTNVAHGDLN